MVGTVRTTRLIALAALAGRFTFENNTAPPVPALPEADASDIGHFVSQLQIVLPVLGVNAIRVPAASPPRNSNDHAESSVFHLRQAKLPVPSRSPTATAA